MASSRLTRLQAMIRDEIQQLSDLPVIGQQVTPSQEEAQLKQNLVESSNKDLPRPHGKPELSTEIPNPTKKVETRYVWLTAPEQQKLHPKTLGSRASLSLRHGQLGSFEESYCPIIELSRYCYKYIHGEDSQRVASAFFDAGKFWGRDWDVFSVSHPDTNHALGLVTESQFKTLLEEVNAAFRHLDLHIDSWQREHGLVTKFPRHPDTHPRYLGRSWSKEEYTRMMENAPGYGFRLALEDKLPPPDDRSIEAFKAKMDEIAQLQKAKNKAARDKKMQHNALVGKAMTHQLKRAQRYLGLRMKNNDDMPSESLLSLQPPAIDVNKAAPYPFESATVVICIDVEAYERDNSRVTEVGICTLDTLELNGIPPGVNGKNWREIMRCRHIRVIENAHLINGEFVDGCPGNFEFGKSEFVGLNKMRETLKAAFEPPYSRQIDTAPENDHSPLVNLDEQVHGQSTVRNIIILGHDTSQDISYLNRLGFNPLSISASTPDFPGLVEVLDTAALYRTYSKLPHNRKLSAILAEFDIDGWFCHNAGNDAVYTMYTMLAVAVRDAAERGDEKARAKRAASVESRIQEELQKEEEIKRAAVAAYDDLEGDDGGVPVSLADTLDASKDLTHGVAGLVLDGAEGERGRPHADPDAALRDLRGGWKGRGRARGRGHLVSGGRGRGYVDRDAV